MICFPNAKINLGLRILRKRDDGFHDIETVMLPIPLFDVLEFHEAEEFSIDVFGIEIDSETSTNTIFKTWQLLNNDFELPAFRVSLLKNIPPASGLGGGSADAAFFLKKVNANYKLKMSIEEMESLLEKVGSDCPFFVKNIPALAERKGEKLKSIDLKLSGKHLCLLKPKLNISTREAYKFVTPKLSGVSIESIVKEDISKWRYELNNDFERAISNLFPELDFIKNTLYQMGVEYVSLSGSGPTIYAISKQKVILSDFKEFDFVWQGEINPPFLQ